MLSTQIALYVAHNEHTTIFTELIPACDYFFLYYLFNFALQSLVNKDTLVNNFINSILVLQQLLILIYSVSI